MSDWRYHVDPARLTQRVKPGSRFRRVNHVRQRLTTGYRARFDPDAYDSVHTICLMVGHKKSGASLLGSLLDAHPSIAFADDFDVFDHVAAGFDGYAICHLLSRAAQRDAKRIERVEKAARAAAARRVKQVEKSTRIEETKQIKQATTREEVTRIEYAASSERADAEYEAATPTPHSRGLVPGWPRGQRSPIEVVGEARASVTSRQIEVAPHLLARLESAVDPTKLKLLHLVRSPYDIIAIALVHGGLTIGEGIDQYFENCSVMDELHRDLGNDQIRVVRHEELVRNTVRELKAVCEYLEVDTEKAYLDACAAIVHQRRNRVRSEIEWSHQDLRAIELRISEHPYLEDYTHETGAVA